jgi:hypothetical protein
VSGIKVKGIAFLEKQSSGGDEGRDDVMAWRIVRRGFLVVD